MQRYDLIVIGSGPGGEKAAIQAAKLGKRVLVVEKGGTGGACVHTGTIPSKTLRESVRFLSLLRQRAVYGVSVTLDRDLTIDRLMQRKRAAIASLTERLESNFERNGIDLVHGAAAFVDPHRLRITGNESRAEEAEGDFIVIAVGAHPYRPEHIDFSDPRILDSDTILALHRVPRTLTIVGGGVIACEYATMFAHLGVKINLLDPRQQVLDFLDLEISSALAYLMREQGVRLRRGEKLSHLEYQGENLLAHTESGKVIKSEYLLYAMGRTGNTEGLGLERVGIATNVNLQIEVNPFFQTAHPHVYAVGDVIGPPSLAATAQEQGRLAALHAFTDSAERRRFDLLPTGIYTIPEISTVGATEEQLTQQAVPYEVGTATYRELARGQIMGNTVGRIKLLFHRESLKLLGVHIIGDYATDLVHVGQTVMAFDGTIEYFVDHVFNYPTFSECYRVAALNGLNRL